MQIINRFLYPICLIFSIAYSQSSISGNVNFYYLSSLADNHLINIPFRLLKLNYRHADENLELNAQMAMEYSPKNHTHFLTSSNPQDFLLDLREFYITWYTDFGEFRIGKQIHTWGSVDENSPVDVANGFDFYYLFFQGADRKLASYSTALDVYHNDWKFGFVLSPFHQTNRVPVNDSEFPIKIPIVPQEYQIYPIESIPLEYGGFAEYSYSRGDLRVSYFNGYDRMFNLSGINAFFRNDSETGSPDIDIVFGYRKTKMVGLGTTWLAGDLILRGDIAYFQTRDQNQSIERENPNPILGQTFDFLAHSYPLAERSDYYQTTIQFEYGLPWDITIIGQFFSYDTLNYNSGELPIDEDVNIPALELSADEIDPRNFFTPGMGTPNAALTKKSLTFNLEKTFLENQLKVGLVNLLDVYHPENPKEMKMWGSLIGLSIEYEITQELKWITGITSISGKDNHPFSESYRFKQMEDFSHIRFELKYNL